MELQKLKERGQTQEEKIDKNFYGFHNDRYITDLKNKFRIKEWQLKPGLPEECWDTDK